MKLRCLIPLANFELDVDASFDSRITAIFGPSGSGKTTLLDAIAGLRRVREGEIEVQGKVLFASAHGIDVPPKQRGVGYVPQEGALFPHLSVRNNILFGAGRTGSESETVSIRIEHVLEVLEIEHLLKRSVTRLSGGEAQRVALARPILSHPRLLLLDEPLAALDIGLKERILPYLARVRDEFRIQMIYVTHNLTEVLTLADWVLMMRGGRLIAQGTPRETLRPSYAIQQISEDPFENVFTAEFVAAEPQAGRSKVRLQTGEELFIPHLAQPVRRTLQIRIGADDIIVAKTKPEAISAGNVLPGTVRSIELVDGQAILTIRTGEEFYVSLTAAAVERLGLREGDQVFLIMKTRAFHLV